MVFIGHPKLKGLTTINIRLEDELNEVASWLSPQKQFVVITEDLNLNKLRPDLREGKIMRDVEDVHGLECLVTKPTIITDTTETLLDVTLTNRPGLFKKCGVHDPDISDHLMVYGILTERIKYHHSKVITFPDFKNLNIGKLKETLSIAPWNVGEMFDCVEDCYDYWIKLLKTILQENLLMKKMKVRTKDVPYISSALKSAIRANVSLPKGTAKTKHQKTWNSRRNGGMRPHDKGV